MIVGFAWTSDSAHQNAKDRNAPFKEFARIFSVQGVTWISVQQPRPEDTLERIPIPIHETTITDFADTAAILAQLDLFIAIDSAGAHLAGAMGIETWLLVPSAPEFRWGLGTDKTAWYPKHVLFRRGRSDGWRDVIDRIISDLKTRVASEVPEQVV